LSAADSEPEVDLWGARRRSEFFEQVFHTPLTIEWAGQPQGDENRRRVVDGWRSGGR